MNVRRLGFLFIVILALALVGALAPSLTSKVGELPRNSKTVLQEDIRKLSDEPIGELDRLYFLYADHLASPPFSLKYVSQGTVVETSIMSAYIDLSFDITADCSAVVIVGDATRPWTINIHSLDVFEPKDVHIDGIYRSPVFSPDGTTLAAVATKDLGLGHQLDTIVYFDWRAESPILKKLWITGQNQELSNLRWSQDGREIAWAMQLNPKRDEYSLFSTAIESGVTRALDLGEYQMFHHTPMYSKSDPGTNQVNTQKKCRPS